MGGYLTVSHVMSCHLQAKFGTAGSTKRSAAQAKVARAAGTGNVSVPAPTRHIQSGKQHFAHKQQFIITHTICHNEIPFCQNVVSTKRNCFYLYFCNNITCVHVDLSSLL